VPDPDDLAARLAETTLALVNVPSESRHEAEAAAWIDTAVPTGRLRLAYDGDDMRWYATERSGRPFVLLAGHLDTVPAQGNRPGRIEDGIVHGLGASDMKGGIAVMVELARRLEEEGTPLAYDLGLLFFPREELPQSESSLPGFFAACPEALEADLAVMLEPTDNALHAGCLGNLIADLHWNGESAHSARPWTGRNAIDAAVRGLADILPIAHREIELSGLTFVEAVTVTGIAGGIAPNVVPDRATATVNLRYPPDRTPAEAEARVRELAAEAGADEVAITGNSAAAPVVVETPLAARLIAAGGLEVLPKQAWTPVAEFAAAGVDAVNFGPGATRYAHRRDEQVEIAALVRSYEVLHAFLTDTVSV
jgi:succinyl-diaminopimelate desuccinylase